MYVFGRMQRIASNLRFMGPMLRYNSSHVPAKKRTSKLSLVDEYNDVDSFQPGKKIHGFSIIDVHTINEFNITAIRLMHDLCKCEYLHLYRDDNNNVFSINFRTTPMDNTGSPHILEHTVLCGSKLYPIRDPFFKMLNRSLATFMNAMTGSDYTIYPFSTQNFTDYKNLQRIYLDAVFRPNLRQNDFMQEGWRLEHKDPKDIKSDIIIKGVVYNEMKGAFSESESILAQKIQNEILPDHTYGVISGGDPKKIPDLTWENLKKFHEVHYHPSNARFYSYGNFPLTSTLEYINDEYLSVVSFKSPDNTVVSSQKRWNQPKRAQLLSRFEKMKEPFEKQNTITISLAMTNITDIYETFLLQFITELLIQGPNAPFYKSMIEPNFSGGFSPSTGFDSQPLDSIFTLGLQGVLTSDFERVEKLFNDTIEDVVKNGFEDDHIESVLHRYELNIKHEVSNFGLNLLFGIAASWNHGGDAIQMLKVNKLIDSLRENMTKDKEYLSKTVSRYFKENSHRLILTMTPDKDYEQKMVAEEKKIIADKIKSLKKSQKEDIYKHGLQLLEEQQYLQDTDILPTLKIDHINSRIERILSEKESIGKVQTQVNTANTNGITYFRALLNTSHLTPEQQMLLPLFCYVITKMGTNRLTYQEFDSLINRKTGGLRLNYHVGDSLYQLNTYEPGILISSHCLPGNVEDMWDIWTQIFNLTQLRDVKRFEKLINLYMSNLTHGISDSGHIYAMSIAAGLVSGTAYQKDLLTGLPHIIYMKRLVQTKSYAPMLAELTAIGKALFDKNIMRACLNTIDTRRLQDLRAFESFIENIPALERPVNATTFSSGEVWVPKDNDVNSHHYVLNVPVHFCSRAVSTVPYTHSDYARIRVMARLITSKYLHPELRERQGAYGGGVRLDRSGVLTFYSYRDPRNLPTLDVFDETYNWIVNNLSKITQQDLLEAKLGVFQQVDAPVPPSSKGVDEFLTGLTTDILQRHRAELMSVSIDDLRDVNEKFFGSRSKSLNGKAILGPKNIKTVHRKKELWTVIDID